MIESPLNWCVCVCVCVFLNMINRISIIYDTYINSMTELVYDYEQRRDKP